MQIAAYREFRILLFILVVLFYNYGKAQEDVLKKTITESYSDQSITFILEDLSKKYELPLAYSSSALSLETKVTFEFNEPVEVVLQKLADAGNFEFSMLSGKIILTPKKKSDKKYVLSGYVKDESTGEVLIGATVRINETTTGTISNEYGYYSLTLEEGTHTILFSFIGQEGKEETIDLFENRTFNVQLSPSSSVLEEVIVSPKDSLMQFDLAHQNAIKLSLSEMTSNTTALGETDVIKSLNILPGVQLFRDGSTFFNVRGGDRDQNQILIDDAPIYNPAHFFGLYSSIIPEATKSVKVFKGDLPVKYGGRISSVLDIRTKDGNMKEPQAEGSIGLMSGRLMVEGPLITDKSSFFFSLRRSYIGEILANAVDDLDELYFADLNAKLNLIINEDNRIYISGFSGRDRLAFEEQNGMSWSNNAGSIRWNHVFNPRLFSNTTLYVSRYDYSLTGSNFEWKNHISNASLKSDFSFYINNNNTIQYGFRLSGHNFNPGNLEDSTGNIPAGYDFIPKKNALETSLYIGHDLVLSEKISVNFGLRLSNWSNYGRTIEYQYDSLFQVVDTSRYDERIKYHEYSTLEPRLSLSYQTGPKSLVKFNYTRSAQYINLISNSISPFNNLEVWLPASTNIEPQRSHQVSVGWHWLGEKWQYLAETYYKHLENQIDYINQAQLLLNPTIESEFRSGSGFVYGLESSLVKNTGKLTGRLTYAFSRSFREIEEINGGDPYPTLWDRPHQLVINLSYSRTGKTTYSGSFYASSGAAISTPTAFYEFMDRTVPIYSERNNARLPAYYRFDISANFRLNKNPVNPYQHYLRISFFNFLNHKNAVFYNFNKIRKEDDDFIIPTNTVSETPLEATQIYVYSFIPSVTYTFRL